ncbi:hypothetical protein [Desulfoluna butyratoxydans]|uniref:Uncharacterized protein n=1 Tax=Desulfoluna butyratoxydans TaxID=231438 RepID=A0A4U8YQT6_9BACT|nr:hypothetical protein [Desulfoluna butyratoxydans]VFQ46626.1 hypothetical protein MSL71_42960 [Desulfoluna butyratoxydans]
MMSECHTTPPPRPGLCHARTVAFLWALACTLLIFPPPLAAVSIMTESQMGMEMKEEPPPATNSPKISVSNDSGQMLWIASVGRLYMKDTLSPKERTSLLETLESHLGIQADGHLDIAAARQASARLSRYSGLREKPFSNIYFDDKLNLTGYNAIYLETCVLNRADEGPRFIRYFENGYHPNRALFVKEEPYYKSLYYYLYLTQEDLVRAVNDAVAYLSKNPDGAPPFTAEQIRGLETTVKVCTELDNLRRRGLAAKESPWERIFTPEESAWLDATLAYFTNIETHIALSSYDWFKRSLPLSISSRVIAHSLRQTWTEQAVSHRTVLPLMLFINKGTKQFSVEKLFNETLAMLKMDNREVDLVVLSAMKSWLLKQIEQGIKVEDRTTYKKILDELNVCPTGWIFYNLYACREPLAAMEGYMAGWEGLSSRERRTLFDTQVQPLYYEAKSRIDIVFNDLVKIFGGEEIYGGEYKTTSINHIFHRYRGEIDYTYEFLQAGVYGDALSDARLPLANASRSCLHDFTAAFVKAPELRVNHVNLLNAYTLLFRELAAQGKVSLITLHEREMEELIRSERYRLGSALAHREDNRYDIYRIIADTYLATPRLRTRALKVAAQSFDLARTYYIEAARREGFISGTLPGALSADATEVDDYERQYEYYQSIAKQLGKKILLLLPPEDVDLYNRMQDSRNPEGYLL